MSYEEKNTWAFGVIAALGYVVYLVWSFAAGGGPLDPSTYVWPMVWAIGVGIAAGILAGIVIGASGGRGGGRVDQRDKEIGWLGARVGNSFIVIGGVAALILCFVQAPHAYIANALYLCFVLAAILESVAKLVAYRRGL